MEVDEDKSDLEREEEEEDGSISDLLRDRFRLSAISIAESEAKKNNMEISQPIVACIADLSFKYIVISAIGKGAIEKISHRAQARSAPAGTGSLSIISNRSPLKLSIIRYCWRCLSIDAVGQLAKDLEIFAHHAGRKSVTMADVIVSSHRNEHLAASLRSFRDELKAKEPQSERKRKKVVRKDDKAIDEFQSLGSLRRRMRQAKKLMKILKFRASEEGKGQ